MILRSAHDEVTVTITDEVVIGRGEDATVRVAATDLSVSRRAALLRFEVDGWILRNAGRRSIYLVEPSGEVEVLPTAHGFERRIQHPDCWIRFPGDPEDHAVVLITDHHELPARSEVVGEPPEGSPALTVEEARVVLTDTELRSMVAVYADFLRLPPHYSRTPVSFRAAAVRLQASEGKIKSDHRRVVEKVMAAGGPPSVSHDRERLISWLMTRQVIGSSDLPVLETRPEG